jgi:hypothetical protein
VTKRILGSGKNLFSFYGISCLISFFLSNAFASLYLFNKVHSAPFASGEFFVLVTQPWKHHGEKILQPQALEALLCVSLHLDLHLTLILIR